MTDNFEAVLQRALERTCGGSTPNELVADVTDDLPKSVLEQTPDDTFYVINTGRFGGPYA